MQVTSLTVLTSLILASQTIAKKSYSSSTYSKSSSSGSSSSSNSIEDFSYNTCTNPEDSAIIIEGLKDHKEILKKAGKKIPITFFATFKQLESKASIIDDIHKEKLNKYIGLRFHKSLEKELEKLSADKLTKKIRKLKRRFRKVTGSKLVYVMISQGFTSKAVKKAIEAEDLLPVSGAYSLTKVKKDNIKKTIKKNLEEINIIYFNSNETDVYEKIKEVSRRLKKNKKSLVKLNECLQPYRRSNSGSKSVESPLPPKETQVRDLKSKKNQVASEQPQTQQQSSNVNQNETESNEIESEVSESEQDSDAEQVNTGAVKAQARIHPNGGEVSGASNTESSAETDDGKEKKDGESNKQDSDVSAKDENSAFSVSSSLAVTLASVLAVSALLL